MSRSRALVLLAAVALVGGSVVPVVAQSEPPDESMESAESAEALPQESPEATETVEVTEPTPKPSLPDDLPRRTTSAGPRFAGPATLSLSGTRGSYDWEEVLFGAQEVAVRAILRPGNDSCAARVRLIEDGEARVNVWFGAGRRGTGSRGRERHDTVFDVDYLGGRLRVDSDCERWSLRFTPLEDPDLPLTYSESTYPVRGHTIDELVAQTERVEDKWAAYTEWFTSWVFWTEGSDLSAEGEASCTVTHGETEVDVSIIYPVWRQPVDADPVVAREWERFLEALRVHEQGHVTIALQGADAIDDRLDEGFTGATCAEARSKADAAAERLFKRYAAASRRYDRETDHGVTQGTGLRLGVVRPGQGLPVVEP